eukprot:10038601-Alexandrium_andersonii.AAC.1
MRWKGLVTLQQQAERMRTPSPDARESIDEAVRSFTGRATPASVGGEPDLEGQAADAEITRHLSQLGIQ